mgnify:CR=1 FL=1
MTIAGCQAEPPRADERENLRPRLALSQRLLEIADEAHSTTEQALVQAQLQKDSPTHIAVAERTHTHVSTLVRSLALTQAPEQSIVRLYVWVRLAEWACHNRVEADPVLVPDRPAPAPAVPAIFRAPARPLPLPAYVPSEVCVAASEDDVVVDLRVVRDVEAAAAAWRTQSCSSSSAVWSMALRRSGREMVTTPTDRPSWSSTSKVTGTAQPCPEASTVQIRSPSLTCESGATWTAVTVPATGDSTGISIFMDSRMASSSPGGVVSNSERGTVSPSTTTVTVASVDSSASLPPPS